MNVVIAARGRRAFLAYWLAEHTDSASWSWTRAGPPGNGTAPSRQPPGRVRPLLPLQHLSGVGGAGLFSDGKLNFHPHPGQDRPDPVPFAPLRPWPSSRRQSRLHPLRNGRAVYPHGHGTGRDIRRNARRQGIDLLLIRRSTWARPPARTTSRPWRLHRQTGVTIRTGEEVRGVIVEDGRAARRGDRQGEIRRPGRGPGPGPGGAEWMGRVARPRPGRVPAGHRGGVRVEVHKRHHG
jgi:hypothetical protein